MTRDVDIVSVPRTKPLFSVIVPVYNVAGYLSATLESVQNQTFSNWECICVDDGSTDSSGKILDEFAANDSRFRVIHKVNGGVSSARNVGIDEACGDWLLFLDSDDAFLPEAFGFIERLITRPCTKETVDVVTYGFKVVGDACTHLDFQELPFNIYRLDKDNLDCHAFERLVGTVWAWNACFRRETVSLMRFLDVQPGEDVFWGAQAVIAAHNVIQTDTVLYKYVQRSGSCVHTPRLKHVYGALTSSCELVRHVQKWSFTREVRRLLYRSMRTSVVGQTCTNVLRLRDDERDEGWGLLFNATRTIFIEIGLAPLPIKWLYLGVIGSRQRILYIILLYIPWRMRVFLLNFAFVRSLKGVLRRGVAR